MCTCKSKQKIPRLPFSRKFPLRAEATIYPPRGVHALRETILKGEGYWTLSFEPTMKPNVANVRLQDIALTILPFSFVFDVDGDGRMEYMEVEKFKVSLKDFNLEATKGTINLETGEISMTLGLSVKPKTIPLLEDLGAGALNLSLTERGRINLETGWFETDAGVFTVPKGSLAGMTITADQTASVKISTIELWVNCLAPPVDPMAIAENPPKNNDITICPEDPILLSWKSSADVVNAKIEPGVEPPIQPPTGSYSVVPGPFVPLTIYRAKTVGGHSEVEVTADVRVHNPDVPITLIAYPVPDVQKWSKDVSPDCWSGNIRVREVRIIRPAEEGWGDCFDWPHKFEVELWSVGATTAHHFDVTDEFMTVPGDFAVAGKWDFWPRNGEVDWEKVWRENTPLCIAVKGECVSDS